jgi:hypothetical protein
MATFIPILNLIEQKIYFQQMWRLQYRLIQHFTVVYSCHLPLLFINTYSKCPFPSFIRSLYFYSFQIYFIASSYTFLPLIFLPFYRSSFLSSFFIFSSAFLHILWQFQQSLPALWCYWYGWAIAVTAGGTILPASQHTILCGLWSNSARHKQPLHSLPLYPDCPTHTNDWNLLSSHYRGVYVSRWTELRSHFRNCIKQTFHCPSTIKNCNSVS